MHMIKKWLTEQKKSLKLSSAYVEPLPPPRSYDRDL